MCLFLSFSVFSILLIMSSRFTPLLTRLDFGVCFMLFSCLYPICVPVDAEKMMSFCIPCCHPVCVLINAKKIEGAASCPMSSAFAVSGSCLSSSVAPRCLFGDRLYISRLGSGGLFK